MEVSWLQKNILVISFCALNLYLGFAFVRKLATLPVPSFTERLNKQLRGFCYTMSDVDKAFSVCPSGVAAVVWASHFRRATLHKKFLSFADPERQSFAYLTIGDNGTTFEARDWSVLSIDDCTESIVSDVILSRNVRQVHFIYDVDSQWDNTFVSHRVSSKLFNCHTALLHVLAKAFSDSFEVFFHLSDNLNDISTDGAVRRETRQSPAKCTITLRFDAANDRQVTVRILEMITEVFHNLYGFKYYYVL